MENNMKLIFPAKGVNEAFARAAVGAFATQLDLTLEELADIKTSVSEAVTNAIVHGYGMGPGNVEIRCKIRENQIEIVIRDDGRGIEDIEMAMQPLFTTAPDDERSGMGFTVMQSFMDDLQVESAPGEGTTVVMKKVIGSKFE